MSSHSSPPSPEYSASASNMAPFSPSQNPSPFPSPLPSPHSSSRSSTSSSSSRGSDSSSSSNNFSFPPNSDPFQSLLPTAEVPLAPFAILPPTHAPPPPVTPSHPPPAPVTSTETPPPPLSFSNELEISPPETYPEGLQVSASDSAPLHQLSKDFTNSPPQGRRSASVSERTLVLDISPSRFASTPFSSVPTRPPPQPVTTLSASETTTTQPQASTMVVPAFTESTAPLSFSNIPQSPESEADRSAATSPVIPLSEFLTDAKPTSEPPATTESPPITETSLPEPIVASTRTSATGNRETALQQELPIEQSRLISSSPPRRLLAANSPDAPHASLHHRKKSSLPPLPDPSVFQADPSHLVIPVGKSYTELAAWKIYCAFRCVVQQRVLRAMYVWKVAAAAHVRNQRLLQEDGSGRRPRSNTTGSSGKHGLRSPGDEETKHRMSTWGRLESPREPEAVFHFGDDSGGEGIPLSVDEDLPVVQSNRRAPPKEKTPMPTRLVDYYTVFGLDPTVLKAAESELTAKPKAELPALVEDINSRLSKELTPVVLARWPLANYSKDYPLDPEWAGFGFPDGLVLYTEARPVTMFYAVSTRSVGSHLCHVYLSCSKPLQIGEGKVVYVPVVFMLVSHYPQFEVLGRCLFELYTLSISKTRSFQGVPVERQLVHLVHEIHVPPPGECCEFHCGSLTLRILSSPRYMCSGFELAPLFSMLNADNIFIILAAILCECRILVTSSSRMSLTIASQALLQLIYPFQWHFSYVPVLSNNMLAAVSNFQPFLLGIHRSHLAEVDLEEVILVDLDHNTVRCDTPQSIPKLPAKAGTALRKSLRECVATWTAARDLVTLHDSQEFSKNVYKAMLRFFADILDGYRQFLFFIHDDPRFNSHGFRRTKDTGDDIFFERFVNSMAFNKYMERDYYPDAYHHCLAQPDSRGGFQIDALINVEFEDPPTERVSAPTSPRLESKELDKRGDLYEQVRIRPELATVPPPPTKARSPPYEERRPKFTSFQPGSSEERLKMFMEGVYDCVNLRPTEIAGVKPLLTQPGVRVALTEILMQPSLRTPSSVSPLSIPGTPLLCLTESSFTILADVLMVALDECQKANDFATATAILECAYEFYMEDKPGGTKTRMEAPLHRHPMWKLPAFWSESLTSIIEARKKLRVIHGNKNMDPLSPKGAEQASKFQVEWMIGAIDRMLEFGIDKTQVKLLMRTLSTRHSLSPQQDEMLTNFMGTRLSAS